MEFVMAKAIFEIFTARENARNAQSIITSADWRLAPDAVSLSDIAASTLTFQDDWKNLKGLVTEGRVPGNLFHVFSQGKMGITPDRIPEVTIINSGIDPNEFLVTKRNPAIEQALKNSNVPFSVDRNFWDCGEEFLVLNGDSKDKVQSLVACIRVRG